MEINLENTFYQSRFDEILRHITSHDLDKDLSVIYQARMKIEEGDFENTLSILNSSESKT